MAESTPDAFLIFVYDQKDPQGKDLQGESIDIQFQNAFQLTTYNFSLVGAKGSAAGGGGGGKGGAAAPAAKSGGGAGGDGDDASFPPFTVSMPTQVGSAWLMKLCTQFASGKPDEVEKLKIKTASIYVRRAGANYGDADAKTGQDWFICFTLGGVTIASYQTSIECVDTFAMNYESMTMEYYRCHPKTGLVMTSPYVGTDDQGNVVDNAPIWYQSRTWTVGAKRGDSSAPADY